MIRRRLADAMFFWRQDGKKHLEDHIESLKEVVFEQRLGSMYDKSMRVAVLARHIAGQTGADPELAQRAAELSRCDLMTEMVYEFPDMQGIMGRYQALRDGEDPELAQALDEFYMPRYSGDRLPQTPTGIAIALAERIDTLVGIFGIGMKPTGDKDPYALRRAALGALRILREHSLPLNIRELLTLAAERLADRLTEPEVVGEVERFMLERLRGLYAEQGVPGEAFDAVAAVHPPDLGDFDRRIQAVQAFRDLPEAEALAAANKRIGNILRKAEEAIPEEIDPALFESPAEHELYGVMQRLAGEIRPLLAQQDYSAVLRLLAGLHEPVDHFFDQVMVMAEDPALRGNRLAVLARLHGLFLKVADIARLQALWKGDKG